MLSEVIGVEAQAVVGLGKPQPAGEQFAVRNARIVHVIENAEFHDWLISPQTAHQNDYGRDGSGHKDDRRAVSAAWRYFHSTFMTS